MRIFFLAIAFLLPVSSAFAWEAGWPAFLSQPDDIPLMPGLEEMPSESLTFDTPEGMISESAASSATLAPEQIKRFYSLVLPDMGWREDSSGLFVRQSDRLRIEIAEKDGVTVTRFTLYPTSSR